MKKDYDNLGLPIGASREDIKKAYRRLAMQLHPDRNPSADAAARFSELQDSYDALMNPEKPKYSDRPGYSTQEKTPEQRAAEARKRYQEHMRQEKIRDDRYFVRLTTGIRGRIHKIIIYSCLGLAFCLVMDLFLPRHHYLDRVVNYQMGGDQYRDDLLMKIYTAENQSYILLDAQYQLVSTHRKFIVEKTWFFHIPTRITHTLNNHKFAYSIYETVWPYTPLLILVFLIPAVLLFYREKTVTFTAIYMLSHYGVAPVAVIFLISDAHIFHLLTLGIF